MGHVVISPRNDVLPIREICSRQDRVSIHPERLASCSTSLSTPGANGAISRSRDDVPPIARVSNRLQP